MPEYIEPMKPIIEIVTGQIRTSLEGELYRAVQNVGINVDKDRLLQALNDARSFYADGYARGKKDAVKWISVEERLPEVGKEVLICDARDSFLGMFFLVERKSDKVYFWHDGGGWRLPSDEVTHWMPLPEPPKDGGDPDA